MTKKIEYRDILNDSGDLAGATTGLREFVLSNFSSLEITQENLAGLHGLVRCIEVMASKHYEDVSEFDEQ